MFRPNPVGVIPGDFVQAKSSWSRTWDFIVQARSSLCHTWDFIVQAGSSLCHTWDCCSSRIQFVSYLGLLFKPDPFISSLRLHCISLIHHGPVSLLRTFVLHAQSIWSNSWDFSVDICSFIMGMVPGDLVLHACYICGKPEGVSDVLMCVAGSLWLYC